MATDLSPEETERSAIACKARLLLQSAIIEPGLKLIATGNLARGVVAEMVDAFTWPDFEKTKTFRLRNVVNEAHFLPLFFIRAILKGAKCLRKRKGYLKVTPAGRRIMDLPNQGAFQAVLFRTTFWHFSLSDLAGGLHNAWPKHDIGVLLWCLSVAAGDWQTRERLTGLCTIPINGVLEATLDIGSTVMEARILRPLVWFGLLEALLDNVDAPRWQSTTLYRKTPLFDRVLSFAVTVEGKRALRH